MEPAGGSAGVRGLAHGADGGLRIRSALQPLTPHARPVRLGTRRDTAALRLQRQRLRGLRRRSGQAVRAGHRRGAHRPGRDPDARRRGPLHAHRTARLTVMDPVPRPVAAGVLLRRPEAAARQRLRHRARGLLRLPRELGYGRSISFNHDFLGRDALQAARDSVPRTKVTLELDRQDVREVLGDDLDYLRPTAATGSRPAAGWSASPSTPRTSTGSRQSSRCR